MLVKHVLTILAWGRHFKLPWLFHDSGCLLERDNLWHQEELVDAVDVRMALHGVVEELLQGTKMA